MFHHFKTDKITVICSRYRAISARILSAERQKLNRNPNWMLTSKDHIQRRVFAPATSNLSSRKIIQLKTELKEIHTISYFSFSVKGGIFLRWQAIQTRMAFKSSRSQNVFRWSEIIIRINLRCGNAKMSTMLNRAFLRNIQLLLVDSFALYYEFRWTNSQAPQMGSVQTVYIWLTLQSAYFDLFLLASCHRHNYDIRMQLVESRKYNGALWCEHIEFSWPWARRR